MQFVEVGSLGQVLPDEPVGVFVQATLPRMIGVGEVAICFQHLGDLHVVGELLAIVIGQRMHLGRQGL